MPVTSTKEYVGVPRDSVANYHGKQLVFASWDHHMMIAAPFMLCAAPQMTFRELVEGMITPLVQADPDSAKIDWAKVEWLKSNQPWTPDFERSLADNGIGHKEQIRFRTPGLNTLRAAA